MSELVVQESRLKTFQREHPCVLPIAGAVILGGVAGAVGGTLAVKGMTQKALFALLAKGAVAAKPTLPYLLNQVGPGIVAAKPFAFGVANASSVTAGTTSAALGSVVPLTAAVGAVGGGAAGVGVVQGKVRSVQSKLKEQTAQTETLGVQVHKLKEEMTVVTTKVQVVDVTDLEQIRGIGPVFAKRLNDAGVHTLTDLVTKTEAELETIIGKSRAGAMFDPVVWITEAQQLLA